MKRLAIFLVTGLTAMALAPPSIAQEKLNGAGATFPYVIYSKWFDLYHTKTGIQFNYQSIGSGGGIKQVIEGTVEFAASDAPMSDRQLADAKEKQKTEILHIPTVLGAVAVTYNVPGIEQKLRLTPAVLAAIYLGEITEWNDARIAADNPAIRLPDLPIIVAHRSDGSGTTAIFTDYLSKTSPAWEKKVGRGTSVNWPVGLGGKGNEGVAGLVKQSEGAIGYVELAYAVTNQLQYASIRNKEGKFVYPSFEAVSAAAAGVAGSMPADMRVSITNAAGNASYPISGFTWLLVYRTMKDKKKATALVEFLKWAMTEGQSYAKGLYYAPLPREIIALCQKKIASIRTQ